MSLTDLKYTRLELQSARKERDFNAALLDSAKRLLSNCCYWAGNALGVKGSEEHVAAQHNVALQNIQAECAEYAQLDPGSDTDITFQGTCVSLQPTEGFT